MTGTMISPLNPITFRKQLLNGSALSIVRFCKSSASNCELMDNLFSELESYFKDYVKFHSVNLDDYPQMAREFAVRETPSIFFFKNGAPVDYAAGNISRSFLAAKVQKLLTINKRPHDYNFFL